MRANANDTRDFYDHIYYKHASVSSRLPYHLVRLATQLGPWRGRRVLDVGCGTGEWLTVTAALGAEPAGIDISRVAIKICRQALPKADLHCGPAENLPFQNGYFDFVSCFGSLEHFMNPERTLREIARVSKRNATVLFWFPTQTS